MGNPGPMGIGVVIDGPDGTLAEISERLPEARGTNNIAEYTAMIRGLERAIELKVTHLEIKGDSNLVVQQVQGRFRVTQPHLRPLVKRVTDLAAQIPQVSINWIPREQNSRADKLSYAALGDGGPKGSSPAPSSLSAKKSEVLGSKPSAREHSILCPQCKKPCTLTLQTGKDGSERIRQECPDHGFVCWTPFVEPFISQARKSTAR